jgi:hypothetical protein
MLSRDWNARAAAKLTGGPPPPLRRQKSNPFKSLIDAGIRLLANVCALIPMRPDAREEAHQDFFVT